MYAGTEKALVQSQRRTRRGPNDDELDDEGEIVTAVGRMEQERDQAADTGTISRCISGDVIHT